MNEPRQPQFGDMPFESYQNVTCPRCGWPLTDDCGPYPSPPYPEDPSRHLMHCDWCGKEFDFEARPGGAL